MAVSKKPKAWMAHYGADWSIDTANLSCEQDGAYRRLIDVYWRKGALPDDDNQMARIIREPLETWLRLRPVLAEFFIIKRGRWHNKRADAEYKLARERQKKASEKGTVAAKARWGDKLKSPKKPKTSTMHGAMHMQCPSPSPSPTTLEGSNEPSNASGGAKAPKWLVDFREEATAAKGADWVASWMDGIRWQEIPERAIVCHLGVAAKTLRSDLRKMLAKHEIVVRTEAEIAA